MEDTIPFGKYKGEKLRDVLASNKYKEFLALHEWIQVKSETIKISAFKPTPMGNKIRSNFIGDEKPVREYSKALLALTFPAFKQDMVEWKNKDWKTIMKKYYEKIL
jgi:hypothetical protein